MTKYDNLLLALQRDLDPKFRIREKSSSWVGRLHSLFSPKAAVILGHTCYVPRDVLLNADAMTQLVAHEGVHVAQKRDLGVLTFNYKYAYPLSLAAILFAISMVLFFIGIPIKNIIITLAASGCMLAAILLGVNLKIAKFRAILELEAFATSWWFFYGDHRTTDEFQIRAWVSGIRHLVNSPTYLMCGLSLDVCEVGRILKNAIEFKPVYCMGYGRDYTVRWLLTVRRILLDTAVR